MKFKFAIAGSILFEEELQSLHELSLQLAKFLRIQDHWPKMSVYLRGVESRHIPYYKSKKNLTLIMDMLFILIIMGTLGDVEKSIVISNSWK